MITFEEYIEKQKYPTHSKLTYEDWVDKNIDKWREEYNQLEKSNNKKEPSN